MITQQKPIWHDLLLQPDPYVKSPNQFENTSYKQHGFSVYPPLKGVHDFSRPLRKSYIAARSISSNRATFLTTSRCMAPLRMPWCWTVRPTWPIPLVRAVAKPSLHLSGTIWIVGRTHQKLCVSSPGGPVFQWNIFWLDCFCTTPLQAELMSFFVFMKIWSNPCCKQRLLCL